jgi:2-polyprenyl-6-hydroxyphenyl methylase/3-demethylubiquinone-9 3-methyltransferase
MHTPKRDLASHFEFGRNWSEYAELIDAQRIDQAIRGLERLAGRTALEGRSFLDIGCGSGLHSLAALHLGAARVLAVDLDPHSVATARQVLSQNAPEREWEVREKSVFDLDPQQLGTFDVVYAWGSLHHTGAMYDAWTRAAGMVAPGGILIVAVYRKTRLCRLWKIEKWLYTKSPAWIQRCLRAAFVAAMRLAFFLTRRDFRKYRESYGQAYRGMNYEHDVHDWLGGYPYESVSPTEADRFRQSLEFVRVRLFVEGRTRLGLFGSGNDEYVWQRVE